MFLPDCSFDSISDITADFLKSRGIKGLFLDVDNTLTVDESQTVPSSASAWLSMLKENGISAVILSNNHRERVEPFAKAVGLDFICEMKKPLIVKLTQALAALKVEKQSAAVVGDQIFTDVLFANAAGILSILVEPVGKDVNRFVKFKRIFEAPIKKRIKK